MVQIPGLTPSASAPTPDPAPAPEAAPAPVEVEPVVEVALPQEPSQEIVPEPAVEIPIIPLAQPLAIAEIPQAPTCVDERVAQPNGPNCYQTEVKKN